MRKQPTLPPGHDSLAGVISPRFLRGLLIVSPAILAVVMLSLIEWWPAAMQEDSLVRTELNLPMVWLMQSLICGSLTVLCFATWLNVLLHHRWPSDESLRGQAGLCVCWTHVAWTAYASIGMDSLDDGGAFLPLLVLAAVAFGIVLPLLWHAMHRLRRPGISGVVLGGFLFLTFALQLGMVKRIAAEPELILLAHSALVALAVAIWLAVYSATANATTRLQTR